MQGVSLTFQSIAIVAFVLGTYFDVDVKRTKNQRLVMATSAFFMATLFFAIGTVTLLIANNYEWTIYVTLRAITVILSARACYVRLIALKRRKENDKRVVAESVVKTLDDGVKILLLAGSTHRPDVPIKIPDGLMPYCTSGLAARYKHPELSLVLKLDDGLAEKVLAELSKRVAAGAKFKHGQTVSGIVSTDIMFIQDPTPDLQGPLRVIFPDANGRWPDDNKCNHVVAKQLLSLEDIWIVEKSCS